MSNGQAIVANSTWNLSKKYISILDQFLSIIDIFIYIIFFYIYKYLNLSTYDAHVDTRLIIATDSS